MFEYKIHCSVRDIVELVFRSGSLDYRYKSSKRAVRGTQIHSILQKRHTRIAMFEGFEYESELMLQTELEYKEIRFEIEGRADGVVRDDSRVHIEEIKSTVKQTEDISQAREVHMAQAKCYGYLYCLLYESTEAVIHLTYCNTESLETKEFQEKMSVSELREFFYGVLEKYYFWCELSLKLAEERNESVRSLSFPFGEFRKGQRDFSAAVYRSIFSAKKLFAQAPTGMGKTVSTLFPAIKFLPEIKTSPGKIFYLTAKNITRNVAEGSLSAMVKKGLKIKAAVLSAKEKSCINEGECICAPEKCKYADGFYDRLDDGLKYILNEFDIINYDILKQTAVKYDICPFELGIELSSFADVIICDYNYAYDPKAKLKRFFGETKGDYIALVDEAHNLGDRAREMFGADITKKEFNEASGFFKSAQNSHIAKTVYKINEFFALKFSQTDEKFGTEVNKAFPDELLGLLENFVYDADFYLMGEHSDERYEKILELYFRAQDFLRISQLYDNRFCTVYEKNEDNLTIRLMCIDPSFLLSVEEENFISTIFFSATLTPLDYFIEILGGEKKKDNYMSMSSPFDSERLKIVADTRISTTYKRREKSCDKIADRLFEMVNSRKGNYFAFFPSYKYMSDVFSVFSRKYSQIPAICQRQSMNERQKAEFIDTFKEGENAMLGFVVLGGAFSEGIDLKGESLIGAAIIGVGLPMVCVEKNIISEYYRQKNNSGFEYAYKYPGMNKVLQAAGRVIRCESDKGVILLIDERYGWKEYTGLFPRHWKNICSLKANELGEVLEDFWKG